MEWKVKMGKKTLNLLKERKVSRYQRGNHKILQWPKEKGKKRKTMI